MNSPKVNFNGWAEAVASVDTITPPKPGYQRLSEIACEIGVPPTTFRDQLRRLLKTGTVDMIERNGVRWYKLK